MIAHLLLWEWIQISILEQATPEEEKLVLCLMNFLSHFVLWIRACVTSTMHSVKINDHHGFFHGGQEIRQGDPY